jgi:hypothetical protein
LVRPDTLSFKISLGKRKKKKKNVTARQTPDLNAVKLLGDRSRSGSVRSKLAAFFFLGLGTRTHISSISVAQSSFFSRFFPA